MPLYFAVKNPYEISLESKRKLSKAPQEYIDAFTQKVKDLGHDGVTLTFDDGSMLYLEEVRTGKNRMAMLSMRKYPGTKDFDSIAQTLLSNARSDAGDARIVPANNTGMT